MTSHGDEDLNDWWQALLDASSSRRAAIDNAYQQLENAGLINRVTVHRFICQKHGCVLATVVRVGGETLARTKDYKLSPGLNRERTVESARRKNTLDGDRHWPGHTHDVADLALSGESLGIDLSCRHGLRTVRALDVMMSADGVVPGHPGPPSVL